MGFLAPSRRFYAGTAAVAAALIFALAHRTVDDRHGLRSLWLLTLPYATMRRMATVIAGLGNPGPEYAHTRHNAGRMAVELLAKEASFGPFEIRKKANASVSEGAIEGEKTTLVIPQTFMNQSGKAITPFVKSVKAAKQLLVIQDDLDLPLGTIKMVFARGSGGHKGIESVMRALKTDAFARIRIGISGAGKRGMAKKPAGENNVIKHVIGKFSPKEEALLKKTLQKAANVACLFATEGIEKAMQEANTR
jgi:peptidyl-tRNA hydrolase, PTH1 family